MDDDEITVLSEAVIKSMSFSEKCSLLHGQHEAPKATGFSSFVGGVPRLGVPAMVQHDGPAGCNSLYETTNLPVEMLAGCTFDQEMARKYGQAIKELAGEGANLTTEALEDPHGYVIPPEYLFADENGEKQGLIKTYGIKKKIAKPNFPFGAPPMDEGGDGDDEDEAPRMMPFSMEDTKPKATDMEGYVTSYQAGVDEKLEYIADPGFLTGGSALPKGSVYTWKGFIKAPEDGEYTIALHHIGGNANIRLYDGETELFGSSCTGMGGGHGPQWNFDEPTPEGMTSAGKKVVLTAGKLYRVIVTGEATFDEKDLQLRLAWVTPSRKMADYDAAI